MDLQPDRRRLTQNDHQAWHASPHPNAPCFHLGQAATSSLQHARRHPASYPRSAACGERDRVGRPAVRGRLVWTGMLASS
eukprot:188019-Pleurochrysis_carterae.AAC.2